MATAAKREMGASDGGGSPPELVVNAEALRRTELFGGCEQAALDDVMRSSSEMTLASGELLFSDTDRTNGVWVVLEGELVISKTVEGDEVIIDQLRPGAYIGELSLLTGDEARHRARAGGQTRLLHIPGETFRSVLHACRPVMETVLRTMASRLRRIEHLLMVRERMAELGTLAAGLAHELNNPAAATKRAAELLREQLAEVAPLARRLAERPWTDGEIGLLRQLETATSARDQSAVELDALERSDREDAVRGWLESNGVERAWGLAPALVEHGVTPDQLETITRGCDLGHVIDALEWSDRLTTARQLLDEIGQGTSRIAEIVKAVKSHAYVDTSSRRDVDVHEGIEQSLTLLAHKLRARNATVKREYDRTLPPLATFGTSLTQVWINLLDNASDAVAGQGGGEIRVRTRRDGDTIAIEVIDSGPGIPEESVARVFDSFFTTKEAGKGTGLGLEIVRRIVRRHRGTVEVESRRGETRFTVRLPLGPAEKAKEAASES